MWSRQLALALLAASASGARLGGAPLARRGGTPTALLLRGGDAYADAAEAHAEAVEAEDATDDNEGLQTIADADPKQCEAELDVVLEEAGSRLVVLDYYASWCGPCKKIAPLIDELARKASGKVVFVKVDVDVAKEFARAKGVKSMPTFQFYRNAELVDTIVGADRVRLRERVMAELRPAWMRGIKLEPMILAAAVGYFALMGARVLPDRTYALFSG